MKTRIIFQLVLLVVLDVAFVVTLIHAFLTDNMTLVTVTCLYGAIAHTHLAPTTAELALIRGKKS